MGSTLKSDDDDDGDGDRWLRAHHAQWDTPPSVLRALLRPHGFEAIGFERLIIGQANEVHAVETASGERLIVRLSHRPDTKFFTEVAAIAAVRAAGIPAPEVLAVERLDGDGDGDGGGAPTAVIVERRIPGILLDDVDADDRTRLVEDLGGLLAAIHAVEVEGFGNLSPELHGTHPTYPSWFIGLFVEAHLPEAIDAVGDDDDARALILRAAGEIEAAHDTLAPVTAHLAHGDLSPANVLVDGGRISGVIDWEAVKGGPPANDFAWWSAVQREDGTFDALLSGYERAGGANADDHFWAVFRLAELRILISLVGYAARVGDVRSGNRAKTRLAERLSRPSGPAPRRSGA